MTASDFLRNRFLRGLNRAGRTMANPDPRGSSDPAPRLVGAVSAETASNPQPAQLDAMGAAAVIAEHPDPARPAIYPRLPRIRWKRWLRRLFAPRPAFIPPVTVAQPADLVVTTPEQPAAQHAGASPFVLVIRRILYRLHLVKRVPTPEELLLQHETERRQALEAQLVSEAKLFKDRLISALNRRGLCYRYKKSERDLRLSGIQSVKFVGVKLYPEALYFFIDTAKIPRDIGILQLMEEDVLTDLSIACGKRVTGHYSERSGAVYIVERASGVFGIPVHVKFNDLLEAFPASADGLSIPFGLTTNSRTIYRSLSSMYSMLIGGTIGAGKSNFANIVLCTLIRRNSPNRLKLLLVDLKGGLEFSFYEGIPHLLTVPGAPAGICYERENVPDVLTWLMAEGERRIGLIRDAGHKDIGKYNAHRKSPLPHLVLMIDEWADIRLERKTGARSEELITNIASRFRAVGIHVIICTQMPKVEVISTRIKGVLPAKVAFSCPTNTASMLIIDTGAAKGLEPAGRCILQYGEDIPIQTPFISDTMIHEIVAGAISGKFESTNTGHDITEQEIFEYALQENQGWLSLRVLYEHYRARGISRAQIEKICSTVEGEELVIGTSMYKCEPATSNRARRLVAVVETEGEKQVEQ